MESIRAKAFESPKAEFLSWVNESIPLQLTEEGAIREYVKDIHPMAFCSIEEWRQHLFQDIMYQDGWFFFHEGNGEWNINIISLGVCEDYPWMMDFHISPRGWVVPRWTGSWKPGHSFRFHENSFHWSEGDELLADNRILLKTALEVFNKRTDGQLLWDINNKYRRRHPLDGFFPWFSEVFK